MVPATTPGSPSNLTATFVSSSSIQISWSFNNALNGGSAITDYQVYWDNGQNGLIAVASQSTGLQTTFTTAVGNVTAGRTYGFWVVAVNFIGVGSPTNKLYVLAAQAPNAPVLPTVVATFNSY
jgi:Fibronectin type III domain